MKRILWGVVLAGLVLLAACGAEKLIEKPAGEMNLRLEDLGASYRLEQEKSLPDLLEMLHLEESPGFLEASLRVFTGVLSETGDISPSVALIAAVLRCDSSGGAQAALQDIRTHIEGSLRMQDAGLQVEKREPPQLVEGEIEVDFARATVRTGESYLLLFRRRNVLGFLVTAGPAGAFSEEQVIDLARKMAGRVPLPQP